MLQNLNKFMIVNKDTITNLPENEQKLISSLLEDLPVDLNIYWQDWHNEYSPERTDPCPDYYGYYRICSNKGHQIGVEMTLEELDNAIMIISDTLEYVQNELCSY